LARLRFSIALAPQVTEKEADEEARAEDQEPRVDEEQEGPIPGHCQFQIVIASSRS